MLRAAMLPKKEDVKKVINKISSAFAETFALLGTKIDKMLRAARSLSNRNRDRVEQDFYDIDEDDDDQDEIILTFVSSETLPRSDQAPTHSTLFAKEKPRDNNTSSGAYKNPEL